MREMGGTGRDETGTTYAGPAEGDRSEPRETAAEVGAHGERGWERGEAPESPTNHLGHKDQPEREFRNQYPDEYLEPMNRSTVKIEPFSGPRELSARVNPDRDTGEPYHRNCADCARCFERGWRGNVEEAAGRAYQVDHERGGLVVTGETSPRTEEWAGERFTNVYNPDDLRERIQAAGHGASVIVHSDDHDRGYGHAYNVVNYQGTVYVVDSQHHEIHQWDDRSIHPLLSDNSSHRAMAWNVKGQRIW
jgi:Papain fold toxin 1, glutamine deamidase